jgi:hypothetical protein
MTAPSFVYVLKVHGGRALPDVVRLSPGRAVPPTSFGRMGQWRVLGPGVCSLHGYLQFDGASLHVRIAGPDAPLQVNGVALGAEWVRVDPPCRISAGAVTIAFTIDTAVLPGAVVEPDQRIPEDLEETRMMPPRAKSAPQAVDLFETLVDAVPFALTDPALRPTGAIARPGGASYPLSLSRPTDLEATRVDTQVAARARDSTRPVVGDRAPIEAPLPAPAAAIAAARRRPALFREGWRRAPRIQKIALFLVALAFVAVPAVIAARGAATRALHLAPARARSIAPTATESSFR